MPELDLEERLRETVTRRSEAYSPSPELPSLIHARVRERRRRRTAVLGAVAAGVLALGGLGAVLAAGADDPGTELGPADSTTTSPPPTTTATTAAVPPTTTATTDGATTTTPSTTPSTTAEPPTSTTLPSEAPAPGSGAPVTDATPLDRAGIGPIEAGMTLRQVQAAGIPLRVDEPLGTGTTCSTAGVEGTGLWLLLRVVPGSETDPLDAVVLAAEGATSTVEAVAVGQTREQLWAAYGEPTEVRDSLYLSGGTIEIFAEGRFAYGATLDGAGVITHLESGLVDGVGLREGCA